MSARYRELRDGVLDLETGERVLPDSPRWAAYLAYFTGGGEVEPLEQPPEPKGEAEARTAIAESATLRRELAADEALKALRARTPAQVDAWIDNNVTNLGQAREVLKLLARVVAQLARERL